jgi:hypothetical protein
MTLQESVPRPDEAACPLDPEIAVSDDDLAPSAEAPPGAAATITVLPGGPLLVRGDVAVLDADGTPLPRRRATLALCRCGRTSIAPYCDGAPQRGRRPPADPVG